MKGKENWFLFLVPIFILGMFLSACSGSDGASGQSSDSKGKTELPEKYDSSNSNAHPAPKSHQVLNLAANEDISTLDANQILDDTSTMVASGIFAGLMRLDKDGNVVPDMAASEPKVSEDQRTMTFKIRKDAKWSNGDPVTAQDFVFSWHRELDPKTGAQYSFIFQSVGIKNAKEILDKASSLYGKVDKLGVKAIDDHTLQVKFDNPQPFFKSLLWFAPFLPVDPNIVKKYGDKYAVDADKLVFNGPFKLSSWKHGEGWTINKNEDYWNADNYKLKKADFKVVKELSAQVNLYNTGKIESVGLNGAFVDQYKKNKNFHKGLQSATKFIYMQEGNRALKNKKIRQALYNGIDRKALTDTLLKTGDVPMYSVVPKDFKKGPDGKDFRSKYPKLNKKSLEQAKNLWEEGLKEVGMKTVELNLVIPDDDPNPKVAEFIKAEFEKNFSGIKINIQKQPWSQYLKLRYGKKFDLALSGWAPDYQDPMTFLDLYLSDNKEQNIVDFNNKKFDKLIHNAKGMGTQPKKRWENMQEAEKILMDNAAVVPLFQQGQTWLTKPYVKDLAYPVYGPQRNWVYSWIAKH